MMGVGAKRALGLYRSCAPRQRIVAEDNALNPALVEKDCWVTHALWALEHTGLEIWFKGGTSLSKGFELIQRFSEDLDLKVEGGSSGAPAVKNWSSLNKGPVASRRTFFETLEELIVIPGASVKLDRARIDKYARSADYRVLYSAAFANGLPAVMSPFVKLEIGSARVTPFLERSISSFVHDWLHARGQLTDYTDNRSAALRCVHPLVSLVEKIDAIVRRSARGSSPATFVRHYEDAANIIFAEQELPPLERELADLIEDMLAERSIASFPSADDLAFSLDAPNRRDELEKAYEATAPTYWGRRISLQDSCELIREWLAQRSR